jgi:hypothetical protein
MICPHCKKEISIKEQRIRSLPQSKYYWGVCVEILSGELGYTKNETHEILKQLFLSEVKLIQTKEGIEEIRVPKSTTELDTVDMEKYLSDIRQWASLSLGIYIFLPNEEYYKDYD